MEATTCQKLGILTILENLSRVTITSEKSEKEFVDCVAQAFKSILLSHSPVLKLVAMSVFANFAHVTQYSAIIELTAASNPRLQQDFVDFLQKKLPMTPVAVEPLSQTAAIAYKHQCRERVSNEIDSVDSKLNPKRFKFDKNSSDSTVLEETLARFKKDSCYIVENISVLSGEQRDIIRTVCEKFSSL